MHTSVSLLPADLAVPASLLDALATGLAYLNPVYAAGNSEQLLALTFERLSPVAQRLLGLPAFVEGTVSTLLPQAVGFADFCHATFQSEELGHYAGPPTPHGGPGWRAVAQRQGEQLVVAITEAAPAPSAERPAKALPLAPASTQRLPPPQVLAQAPVAICLLRGPGYRLSYFNAAFERLLPGGAEVGRPLAELLPQAIAQGLVAVLSRVYATGEPYLGFERPLTIGAGRTTYLNLAIQPYQQDGQLVGLMVFGYDMTEQVLARRQAQKQKLHKQLHATHEELRTNYKHLAHTQLQLQLLNQELEARVTAGIAEAQQARAEAECQRQRLERLFQQSPAAISILSGPELVYEFVNARYQELFPGRQLLGVPLGVARPAFDDQENPTQLRAVYETGITHEGRAMLVRVPPAGGGPPEDRYFDCLYQPRYDGQSRIDGVLIFALEVTAQVRARRQMQQLNQELETRVAARTQEAQAARAQAEAKHQQLRTLIEQAPAAMAYISGPELRIVSINAAACQMWEIPQANLTNRPLLDALPQLRELAIPEQLLTVMRTQVACHAQGIKLPVRQDNQAVDGYFNYVFQPIVNDQDGSTDVLVVAIDVTEQVRAHQQVRRFNQELEERVAAGVAVAQQARAEAELERHRLEQFFKQAPAAICVLNGPELVYEMVNPAYQQRFPGRQLLGLPMLDALPELTGHLIVAQLREVYATGTTHEGHEVLLTVARLGDGQVEDAYFDCVHQARYNEQGVIDGVLVFALDVTAKVRAQRQATALQAQVLRAAQLQAQAQATFHQVFDQTSAAIAFMRGSDFRFEYVNQAYERLFPGVAQLGLPIVEALKNTRPQGLVPIIHQVYRTGRPYVGNEVRSEITQLSGPPLVKYLNFTLQVFREGKQIVGLSAFAYDVTEQVLARRQRELVQAQLQAVFEHVPVALALLDGPNHLIKVANPALLAFCQQTQEQVLGQPFFAVWPSTHSQDYSELLARLWRTGESYVAEEQLVEFEREWGSEQFYFHLVLQPIPDARGKVVSIMLVANEITQQVHTRKQLAEANNALRTTNAQLTRTNTDLDNFIYTASHDLKAPISNIESLLLMLRQQLPPEARLAGLVPKVLGMMQDAIERFQLTIAHLTDISRLQQVHTELAEPVSLEATVEAVRLDLASELEATHARLTVDVHDCQSLLLAPHHLRSVVYNLLGNALKYRHPDRVPNVQLSCRTQANMAVLTVKDNGLGLSTVQQQKIFGLFRRLHAHVDGSGVGLYIVKRIVENAGGTIAVQSKLGVGSVFIVSLPKALPPFLT